MTCHTHPRVTCIHRSVTAPLVSRDAHVIRRHMCVYVCVYIRTNLCMHIYMYINVCMYIYICIIYILYVYMYICLYIYIYICTYIYIYIYVYRYIYMYIHVYRYTYICIYIFIYIYSHIYIFQTRFHGRKRKSCHSRERRGISLDLEMQTCQVWSPPWAEYRTGILSETGSTCAFIPCSLPRRGNHFYEQTKAIKQTD